MGNRFEDLDRFLPPEPASSPSAAEPEAPAPAPRIRSGRSLRPLRRALVRATGLALPVGLAVAAIGFAARLPAEIDPGAVSPDGNRRLDVSLGDGSPAPVRGHAPEREPTRRPDRQRAPRRVTRRVQIRTLPRSAAPSAPTTVPAPARPVRAGRAERPRTKPAATKPAAAKPAPPQTPLFDCVRTERHEYYVTIDRARAGQMSSPGSGWRCSVVGQVYAFPGEGRVPIELDDGTAYVLRRRTETEPSSEQFALYRHWAGSDFFYSSRVADGGLVGYIAR